ncbi:MAG: hypothetical protein WCR72_07315 [Bacteroidota bacterium]
METPAKVQPNQTEVNTTVENPVSETTKTVNKEFWKVVKDSDDKPTGVKIDHEKYIDFINSLGYKRFDQGNDFFFVRIVNKVIEEVTKHKMKDSVIQYVKKLPIDQKNKGLHSFILSKFYTSPALYFSETKFSLLMPEPDMVMNEDTKDECYIYYKNGFVICTDTGYDLKQYSLLNKYIWKNQIKARDFMKYDPDGMFSKFVFNIAGKKEDRFKALKTLIGYSLHSYFETKLKAINLTDSTISDSAEGRTGKTLLGHGIEKIKNLCEISGKDFDPTNKHKYQNCRLDTQIVFLNDIKRNFRFENLFNDISDHITVDQKNMQPFNIKAKMLISSNDTFRVDGGSAKDRLIEFELADHYSNAYSPYDEFGQWFFTEWNELEWLSFDNFMMTCICDYLKHGLIEAEDINLGRRKQIEHTNPDFVEWMNDKIESGGIKPEKEYDKKELHTDFLEAFPEYKEDKWLKRQSNFTRYLQIFVSTSDTFSSKTDERRGGGLSFIKFHKKGYNKLTEVQEVLPF